MTDSNSNDEGGGRCVSIGLRRGDRSGLARSPFLAGDEFDCGRVFCLVEVEDWFDEVGREGAGLDLGLGFGLSEAGEAEADALVEKGAVAVTQFDAC